MAHIELFSEERIQLMLEVRNHPELVELLQAMEAEQGIGADEFEIRLAAIAAYCSVIVDGEYTQAELDKLCDILITKLRAKRAHIFV